MSKLQVDDIVNKDDTGSVGFSRGAVVTGVCTATTFSGNGSGLTGVASTDNIITGTAATFSGGITVNEINVSGVATFASNVSIAGTLTYEDVTNIDSVGIITARNGVKTNVSPAITIRDDTTEKGFIGFNGNDPFIGRKNGVGLLFQNNKIRPVDGDDGSASNNTVDIGEPTYKFKDGYFAGTLTAGGLDVTGQLKEEVNITAGKLSENTNIDLDNGMVHYFTTTETSAAVPNITSSVGINTSMSTGDTISVTIVTTAAAAAFAGTFAIDHKQVGVTTFFSGGAPTEGGSSGKDVTALTIVKTGDAAFDVLASITNFE